MIAEGHNQPYIISALIDLAKSRGLHLTTGSELHAKLEAERAERVADQVDQWDENQPRLRWRIERQGGDGHE